MRRDYRVIRGLTWTWLASWIIQSQVNPVSSMIFWTAYVELRYLRPGTNQTMISVCDCGMYGSESPLKQALGFVVLPNSDSLACQPNTTFTIKQEPWIALIKRGNCTHAEKIQAAQREGASAVVIYNVDGTGNGTNSMSHAGMAFVCLFVCNPVLWWTGVRNIFFSTSGFNNCLYNSIYKCLFNTVTWTPVVWALCIFSIILVCRFDSRVDYCIAHLFQIFHSSSSIHSLLLSTVLYRQCFSVNREPHSFMGRLQSITLMKKDEYYSIIILQ